MNRKASAVRFQPFVTIPGHASSLAVSLSYIALGVGVVILTLSADRLVLSAARLSRRWGLSPILIGAVVIGLGTSIPELVVSLIAADPDKALGNVVGSNISNVTLVLGATAIVAPIATSRRLLRREGLLMFGAVVLLAVFLANDALSRIEGFILVAAMVPAVLALVSWARSAPPAEAIAEVAEFAPRSARSTMAVAASGLVALALTIFGAWLLVEGAVGVAEEIGLSDAFVGLVLLAVGTSLPELATSLAAARRGESGLAIGNVLGSNLFNSLVVAGTVGIVRPGVLDAGFTAVSILMVASAGIAGVLAATGHRVVRWEGALLLGLFGALLLLVP
jgi:cation:H+ antiporter